MSGAVHHLEDCVYLPEACPLRCVSQEGEKKGEVVRMERRHIPEHMRDSCRLREIVCEFCEGKVKASEMNPHLEDCEEFPLDCPNGCSREGEDGVKEVKRKDIPVHLDNHCPLQKVQCPYWDHGCKEEIERRHTDTHEKEFLHIHYRLYMTKAERKHNESIQLLANRIAVLEKENSDKHLRIASLTKTLLSQLPTGRLEWKVEGVKQKIQNKVRSYSDPFYTGLYKCLGKIEWNYKDTENIGVFIHIMRGDFDAKLHWPIRFRFTIVLINQINSKDNLLKTSEISKADFERLPECLKRPSGYKNRAFGIASFISNTTILEEKYYKQDSITLHISVELLPSL